MAFEDLSNGNSLSSLASEAERILFKNNLDLAEIYDVIAYIYTNRDSFETAFKVKSPFMPLPDPRVEL